MNNQEQKKQTTIKLSTILDNFNQYKEFITKGKITKKEEEYQKTIIGDQEQRLFVEVYAFIEQEITQLQWPVGLIYEQVEKVLKEVKRVTKVTFNLAKKHRIYLDIFKLKTQIDGETDSAEYQLVYVKAAILKAEKDLEDLGGHTTSANRSKKENLEKILKVLRENEDKLTKQIEKAKPKKDNH